MYLQKISIDTMQRCMADKSKVRVKGTLSDDVGELLPYLNGVFDKTIYNHKMPKLEIEFEDKSHKIILTSKEVRVDRLSNSSQGRQVLDWLKEKINEIYAQQDQLEPDYKSLSNLKVPEVYKHLPQLNCAECGEQTCFAFATMYVKGDYDLQDCPPLFTAEFAEAKEELEAYLQEAMYKQS
ncbi:(Fe-S)-binding protein [Fuchsiella alkaliacetigena]|uniref:(Fe-S)-binding protein n=1 Tax=Fuchsiella alkaliacetigena TaxID=957042 RepID=UPI00200AB167|nr:(Fe-S)-binding protein [Fuchsiella alkaliacetigena]MCK8824157.1 hypothetical protein [Fuchsiella alkaliacetigena]